MRSTLPDAKNTNGRCAASSLAPRAAASAIAGGSVAKIGIFEEGLAAKPRRRVVPVSAIARAIPATRGSSCPGSGRFQIPRIPKPNE